ncbi:MAG: RNA polymerase factor sigma-54 [Betaproteobacteria bacterium]|jgi:RNA polymerase sigma-54 factor|nr:RNA polymerase factor sigma-54 [Betaproteobacteria bacterium]
MKQTLQLKLSQHLALTPQLQQSIRLLQLSTLELNQEIDNFLQDNPLLEREDEPVPEAAVYSASGDALQAPAETLDGTPPEPNFGDSSPADWLGEGGGSASRDDRNDDEPSYAEIQAAVTSLRDHLGTQLAMMPLSERDRCLVRLLIEALDDDGYLAQDLDELVELLPAELEVDIDDLQIALKHLQNFDPPGIGARNASECLALQLANLPSSKTCDLALKIVRNHLDQLAARDYVRLRKAVACSEDELREAQALIRSLNPRPGAQYSPSETRYVIPDVVVRKVRGQWAASLNAEAMPRLRINRLYADILQGQRGSGLASQLQEAKWLIKNVQQRFETIQRVSQAIVDRQRQFFEHGDVAMRPLTLREIADQLGLHESTISRVTTQKYMASPRGVYELKYFFGSHVATEAGGAASSTAIRALIKQLVSAEDGKKPLSDAQLAEILGQQGIMVARRTVAKYREALNIPPVNLRKSI